MSCSLATGPCHRATQKVPLGSPGRLLGFAIATMPPIKTAPTITVMMRMVHLPSVSAHHLTQAAESRCTHGQITEYL